MSEGFKPANESKESFDSKKAKVVAFIEQELKKTQAAHDTLASDIDYYRNRKPSATEIPATIPPHILAEGGLDLSDWRTEIGSSQYEDQQAEAYRSHEVDQELNGMHTDIQHMQSDLEYFKDLKSEDDMSADDHRVYQGYLEQIRKSA